MKSAQQNLYDLAGVSLICSVKVDSDDRIRNLKLICKLLESCFINWEMIVVEQGPEQKLTPHLNLTAVRHYFIETDDAHYKTRNLNLAAALSNRAYLMIIDADVLVKPEAVIDGLKRLNGGIDCVYPFNGIVLNISKDLFNDNCEPNEMLSNLEFLPKSYDQKTLQFGLTRGITLMTGSTTYDATGGALMLKRESFFLAGGFNTNMISYGYEDMELDYRIKALGFTVERLDDYNIYHLEHTRQVDSQYNNFYRSNEAEYERVRSMTAKELKRYASRGFSSVRFNTQNDLQVVDSPREHSIKVSTHNRTSLADLSFIWVIRYFSKRPISGLLELLDYLEEQYDDYEIIIVEIVSRRFKYLENKKNLRYVWLNHEHTLDDGAAVGRGLTTRINIHLSSMDGSLDFSEVSRVCQSYVADCRQDVNAMGTHQ